MSMLLRRGLAPLLAALFVAACARAPEPVHWGVEECAHCQMVISDERYAAQLVDQRGRTFKFDAIECMTAFLRSGRLAAEDLHSTWIADGRDGWIAADHAHYLHSAAIRSPMGGGLAAFSSADAARRLQAEVGGSVLSWDEVRTLELPAHDHGAEHGSHAAH